MDIIFFGNERLATGTSTDCTTIKLLLKKGYSVRAVIAHHEASRSRKQRPLEIQTVAEEYNIPILFPERVSEITDYLTKLNPYIGVLVAYGRIIPESIIKLFPKGIINIHPSLLPLHRGPTPIESVILDGSKETGVSIMQLSQKMDAGDVFGYAKVDLTRTETKQDLASALLDVGGQMLIELLPGIDKGTIFPLAQDEDQATYDALISKDQGIIDWTKPAQQLEREVRAYSMWPRSRTHLMGKEIVITESKVVHESGDAGSIMADNKRDLIVYCGKDALRIDKLIPASKKEMSGESFLAGYGGR